MMYELRQLRREWRFAGSITAMLAVATAASALLVAGVDAVLTVHIPAVDARPLVEAARTMRGQYYPAWSYPQVEALSPAYVRSLRGRHVLPEHRADCFRADLLPVCRCHDELRGRG